MQASRSKTISTRTACRCRWLFCPYGRVNGIRRTACTASFTLQSGLGSYIMNQTIKRSEHPHESRHTVYNIHPDFKLLGAIRPPLNRRSIAHIQRMMGLLYRMERSDKAVRVERVQIPTDAGNTVRALLYLPKEERTNGAVLYCHGGEAPRSKRNRLKAFPRPISKRRNSTACATARSCMRRSFAKTGSRSSCTTLPAPCTGMI